MLGNKIKEFTEIEKLIIKIIFSFVEGLRNLENSIILKLLFEDNQYFQNQQMVEQKIYFFQL